MPPRNDPSEDLVPLLACRACGLVDPARSGADPVCNLVDRDGWACCPCGADPLHGFLVVYQRSPKVQLAFDRHVTKFSVRTDLKIRLE